MLKKNEIENRQQLDQLLKDTKFLTEVKRMALSHKDDLVPENDGMYFQSMMWSKGVIDVLRSRGYTIQKDKNEP